MFKIISAVVLVMMPIISIANGGADGDFPFGSRDLADEEGCYQGQTTNGCGGGHDPFTGGDDPLMGLKDRQES